MVVVDPDAVKEVENICHVCVVLVAESISVPSLGSPSVNSKQKSAVSVVVTGKPQIVYRTILIINSLPLSAAS